MPDSARKLVVVPCCGLGNRIQVIVCGQLLAEDTGRELYVDWAPAAENCAVEYERLFVPMFPAPADVPDDTVCYSSLQRYLSAVPERYRPMLQRHAHVWFAGIRDDPAATVAVFTCHQFLDYFNDPRFPDRLRRFLRSVRPDIRAEVDGFAARHFGNFTVGIHVRRTDWRSQRGLGHYLRQMRRFPDAVFFVCSDDSSVPVEIRKHHPRTIEYPKTTLSRQEPEGLVQALVEMLLLSRTQFLIGTQGSSFSAIARVAGGIPGPAHGQSLSRRDLQLGNLHSLGRKLLRRVTGA
jgi:hypothetical protein